MAAVSNFKKGAVVTNLLTHFSCHASEIKECVTSAIVILDIQALDQLLHRNLMFGGKKIQQEIRHRKHSTGLFIKLFLLVLRNQYTFNSF